jgi:lysophospholipase L1-like esterase
MVRRSLIVVYLVLLHVGAAALFWFCDPGGWRYKVFAKSEYEFDRRAFWRANGVLLHLDGLLRHSPIVLLGDSLIENLPPDLVPPETLNLGLGGVRAAQLHQILGRYPSLHLAKAIVLEIGVNDLCIGNGGDALQAEIQSLAASLPANVPLVWSAILPVDAARSEGKCVATSAMIIATNRLLARICSARGNCVFADAYASMAGPQDLLKPEFHIGDGIHLNRRGYETWSSQLSVSLATGAQRSVGQTPGRKM